MYLAIPGAGSIGFDSMVQESSSCHMIVTVFTSRSRGKCIARVRYFSRALQLEFCHAYWWLGVCTRCLSSSQLSSILIRDTHAHVHDTKYASCRRACLSSISYRRCRHELAAFAVRVQCNGGLNLVMHRLIELWGSVLQCLRDHGGDDYIMHDCLAWTLLQKS